MKKHILVDLYKLKQFYTGLGQFAYHLANNLIAQRPDHIQYTFLLPPNYPNSFKGKGVNSIRTNWQLRYLPSLTHRFDLWHSLEQFPSFVPNRRSPWLMTIHDLNFLIEKEGQKRTRYLNDLQKRIQKVDFISTISNYTKMQIEEHLELAGKPIEVIYNGIDPGKGMPERPGFMDQRPYFFSIGHFSDKKNFEVLLPLMRYFSQHRLILAGNHDTNYGRYLKDMVISMQLHDQVLLCGKIEEAHKNYLYQNCEAFLFPSLAEGFGMPVIEAMYAGKPVYLSRLTALPEIGGEAAFYFENFEPKSMATLIKNTIEDTKQESFRKDLRRRATGFNWQTCAQRYLQLYERCLSGSI